MKTRSLSNRLLMFVAAVVFSASSILAIANAADRVIDYGRDIRPILSDKCFQCHGPDDDKRVTELRLDQAESAELHGAVIPGELMTSAVWGRINSADHEQKMPPPDSEKQLTVEQISLIKGWIEQGAPYSEHWAFLPPKRPPLPSVQQSVSNEIDSFIAAKIEANALQFSPATDRETLVRRLYLDLIGLVPSPSELDRWLAIEDSTAFEKQIVDELLESPHYGERWGRWWLDAARYADSDGFEKDKPRSVWFYRDWVVGAFNSDLPYNQFVIEQIAGDLLPNATQDQLVATGFLRNSMINEEGGADPEQFRIEGMFDRMDAIGKSILGITTQCAQCHSHKYDPLSQREYYQMFAALNDFHEATISAFTPREAAQRDKVLSDVAAINDEFKRMHPSWQGDLVAWEQEQANRLIKWSTLTPTEIPYSGQKFRVLADGSIVSESYAPTRTTDTFKLNAKIDRITAFRIDALMHSQLPRGGPGRSTLGTGAITEFQVTITPTDTAKPARQVKFKRAWSDTVSDRKELLPQYRDRDAANDKRVTGPVEFAIDGDQSTAWTTDSGPATRNRPQLAVFFPEEELHDLGEVEISLTLQQNHGGWNSDDNQNYLLGRYRFSYTDAAIDDVDRSLLPAVVESALLTPAEQRTSQQSAFLFDAWRERMPQFKEFSASIARLYIDYPETDSQLVVARREEGMRPTFVLTRGDFLKPAEGVEAGVPEFLGSLPNDEAPPRLKLARWLVRDESPTTARVIVNRVWQAYFGRGLVATPEDFGLQSSPPSHPELLDWLAVEFVESGWSFKHLHRLITSSRTYQQQSVLTTQLAEKDPQNELLARGPRMRVDAEIVRDIALCVSGLLSEEIGGPSVYPPAPDFLFVPPASYGPKVWPLSDGAAAYRRSLYVHSYRSVPYPPLQMFDAPKGDAACIRRERSNTPLQALVLLNEPQFLSCARSFAVRTLRKGGANDLERLQYAHRWATSRMATTPELDVLTALLADTRSRAQSGQLNASQLLGATASAVMEFTSHDADELAAWTIVCRTLLNLDEAICK